MTETVGQVVDADVAALKARVAALEADATTDFAKVKAWVKTNWPHFITYAGIAGLAVKDGVLKLI